MSSEFGRSIKVSVFGQSHSKAIGVVIDGLPVGERISLVALQEFMNRRRPNDHVSSTKRNEADEVQILSGLKNSVTCGAPLCAVIENRDQRSEDYNNIIDVPRPGHADYTAYLKYNGFNDVSGGGHFSGRLTAPLCIAGGIALQILARRGISIGAHIVQIGSARRPRFNPVQLSPEDFGEELLTPEMEQEIYSAAEDGDSVGGIIECGILGLPGGLGDPMADSVESILAGALFGIPAVKGVEFGAGFQVAAMRGSQNNDPYYMDGDEVKTKTNYAGGILGGITTGMPLLFRIAVKPTSSIGIEQDSVSLSKKENAKLTVSGRHDSCIVPRAVPVAEAVAAMTILDILYRERKL